MAAPKVLVKRGTRAQIDAAGAAGLLAAGEPYLISDEDRFAVGTSSGGFEAMAKQSELGTVVNAEAPRFSLANGDLEVNSPGVSLVSSSFSNTAELIVDAYSGAFFIDDSGELVVVPEPVQVPITIVQVFSYNSMVAGRVVGIVNGELVYVSADSRTPIIGFTQKDTDANSYVGVQNNGFLFGFSGLESGKEVYLSGNGSVSQIVPTTGRVQSLGIALSDVSVSVQIQPPFYLAINDPTTFFSAGYVSPPGYTE